MVTPTAPLVLHTLYRPQAGAGSEVNDLLRIRPEGRIE